jgi:hypothetical protein
VLLQSKLKGFEQKQKISNERGSTTARNTQTKRKTEKLLECTNQNRVTTNLKLKKNITVGLDDPA